MPGGLLSEQQSPKRRRKNRKRSPLKEQSVPHGLPSLVDGSEYSHQRGAVSVAPKAAVTRKKHKSPSPLRLGNETPHSNNIVYNSQA